MGRKCARKKHPGQDTKITQRFCKKSKRNPKIFSGKITAGKMLGQWYSVKMVQLLHNSCVKSTFFFRPLSQDRNCAIAGEKWKKEHTAHLLLKELRRLSSVCVPGWFSSTLLMSWEPWCGMDVIPLMLPSPWPFILFISMSWIHRSGGFKLSFGPPFTALLAGW